MTMQLKPRILWLGYCWVLDKDHLQSQRIDEYGICPANFKYAQP